MTLAGKEGTTGDYVLAVVLRILLSLIFVSGGAGVSTLLGRGLWPGAAIGGFVIAIGLIKERAITDFCKERGQSLILIGFTIYVVILGLATYSELFDLGWFRWLSF